MSKQRRISREFLWPVPPSELEDIEVVEHHDATTGPPLWRGLGRSRTGLGSDGARPGALDAPSLGIDATGPAWRGAEPTRDRSAWRGPLWSAWRAFTPAPGRHGWSGAAERVALLVGGMVIGLVVGRLGLPDPLRGATATPAGGSLAAVAALTTGTATPPAPTILGVHLPPPSTTARTATTSARSLVPALTLTSPVPVAPVAFVKRAPVRTRTVSGAAAKPARAPLAEGAPSGPPGLLGPVRDYAVALSRLDARATQAVYPSVDRGALVQRFTALREQRLTLGTCATSVDGPQALVTCSGTLRYRPRVGDHATRVQPGRWRFSLTKASGTWVITSVDPS